GIPYFHVNVFERTFRMFREACEKEGYEADPMQMGWLEPIYVAETDDQARREYEEHFFYFVKRLLPGINVSPPGYTTLRSYGSRRPWREPQASQRRADLHRGRKDSALAGRPGGGAGLSPLRRGRGRGDAAAGGAGGLLRRDRPRVPRLRRVGGDGRDRRHRGRRLPPARRVGPARTGRPRRGRDVARRLDGRRAGHQEPGEGREPGPREPCRPVHRRCPRGGDLREAAERAGARPVRRRVAPLRGRRRPDERDGEHEGGAALRAHSAHAP